MDQYMKITEQITSQDNYLKVSKLADDLGEKVVYDTANKYLSKFVHPTSISIQARKDLKLAGLAIQGVVLMALFFIQTAFPALINCLDSIAAPPAAC